MANRRCLQTIFSRYLPRISHPQNPFLHPITKIRHTQFDTLQNLNPTESFISISPIFLSFTSFSRHFCSNNYISDDDDDEDDEDDEEDEEDDDDEESDAEVSEVTDDKSGHVNGKTDEEKAKEAEEIGYKVVGPLQESDRVFKTYEPIFAVVQVGSHQFKVSNGDSIFVEKLKYCDVNDKLVLNRVLLLGSKIQTIIGRPILPDAAVHAVVEEHALDAKVIIFKKKRRKNYRRTKGHRQELTKLRITHIEGIEKPEALPIMKTEKKAGKKREVNNIQAIKMHEDTILKTEQIADKKKKELSA